MKIKLVLMLILGASFQAWGMEKTSSPAVSLNSSSVAFEGACGQSLSTYTPLAPDKIETSEEKTVYSGNALLNYSCKFTAAAFQRVQQLFANTATVAQPDEIEMKELPKTVGQNR